MPDPAALQAILIKQLSAAGSLTQSAVAKAFRAVPRHLFLPDVPLDEVYRDEAIPTKLQDGRAISSSSQPAMMAIMLEQLDLSSGQSVLEIGAGTGYNAALLGQLVGPAGRVVSLDIDEDLVVAARAHLAAAAGVAGARNVEVICADGGHGCAAGAPYDRIILTVGAWDIALAWFDQLRPGGKLVLPLGIAAGPQKCVAFLKPLEASGPWLVSQSVRDCAFMRLRGAFAGPERLLNLGPDPGLQLALTAEPPATPDRLFTWLARSGASRAAGLKASVSDLSGGLGLWLGLNAPEACDLVIEGNWAARGLPYVVEFSARRRLRATMGLATHTGLAFLDRPPQLGPGGQTADDQQAFDLYLTGFGPDQGAQAVRQLMAHIDAWQAAGRPNTTDLRIRVYPPNIGLQPGPNEIAVQKPLTQLLIDWPGNPGRVRQTRKL